MEAELKRAFKHLSAELSPENLCCDGECTPAETQARYDAIMVRWRELERQAGRTVTEQEVWGWYRWA